MIWDDVGFLISKYRYNENSLISEVYTKDHGKVVGIIFGGTSKKIKNYLQIGNKFYINYNFKNENKLGYFKIEIENSITPKFFDDKEKLSCIVSTMNLVKILTVYNQANNNIFNLISDFFSFLIKNNWISNLIFWELELLKLIGYDLELSNMVSEEIIDGRKFFYVSNGNEKKYVPNFLVNKNYNEKNFDQIYKGLRLVSDYLDKSILKPNNIPYPKTRNEFISIIKK